MKTPRKSKFSPFVEAREYVRSLQLQGQKEFNTLAEKSERPVDIPSAPHKVYKDDWISWGDWLGTNKTASQKMTFKTFAEARDYVRGLNLKGKDEYFAWSKTPHKPDDIPADPRQKYKDDWIDWGDWLGTYRLATKNIESSDYEFKCDRQVQKV